MLWRLQCFSQSKAQKGWAFACEVGKVWLKAWAEERVVVLSAGEASHPVEIQADQSVPWSLQRLKSALVLGV